MNESEIARIGSTRGKSTLLFGNDTMMTFEFKALMLAAAIWMVKFVCKIAICS